MKKIYLIFGSILFFSGFNLHSQNYVNTLKYTKPHLADENNLVQSTKKQQENKISKYQPIHTTPSMNTHHKQVTTISVARFSSSENVYGLLTSQQKPLQYNSDVNIVTFFHRKSPFFTTNPVNNSGSIVVSWSLNHGINWDSTCIWSDGTNLARFPNGGIYNPPFNTNVNNIYFVGSGMVTDGFNWTGDWFASKSYTASVGGNSTAPPSPQTQFIPVSFAPAVASYYRNYFTYTTDGKVRVLGTAWTTTAMTMALGAAIMEGSFNAGSFTWSSTILTPTAMLTAGGDPVIHYQPYMAWDNSGTIGYVVMLGVHAGASGSTHGVQPIVLKTTNGGTSWVQIPLFDFTVYPDVLSRLALPTTSCNCYLPLFHQGEGMDVTVDAMGRLHLVNTILPTYSSHIDSVFYSYAFINNGACGTQPYVFYYGNTFTHPTIFDFILEPNNTWSVLLLDSLSSEAADGSNICSQWSGLNMDVGARIQVSRNDVGDKIFYSWVDTDTTLTGHHFNTNPDLYMKGYDIFLNMVTAKTSVINSQSPPVSAASSGVFWHYMSPKSINLGGGVYEIPLSFSHDPSYGASSSVVDHYYISGAQFTMADFAYPAKLTTIKNLTSEKSTLNSNVYPNPAHNNINLETTLSSSSMVEIEILNTLGQVIYSSKIEAKAGKNIFNIDIASFNEGMYIYKIITSDKTISGKFLKN